MVAFIGPLVAIVLIQCQEFGWDLLLGWDSSTYAWWATQVQQNGVLPTVVEWRYPNLYILILSGFGWLVGSVIVAEHVLPLIVSLPLFLVIAATHFETYGVLAVALLFACLSFWKLRRFFELLILFVVPVGLLLPVMSSYLTEYVSQTSKLVPFGPPEIIAWSLLYFSGFAIPLMFVGLGSLYLAVRRQNPTARYMLVWLAALVVLLPLAIAIGAP